MMAFAEAHPSAFLDLSSLESSYQAFDSRETSSDKIEDANPGMIDVLARQIGEEGTKKFNDAIEESQRSNEELDSGNDSPIGLNAPEDRTFTLGEKKPFIERLASFAFGMDSDVARIFSKEGARQKFKRNENFRRSFLARIKNDWHAGFVNSYYELEELNELILEDLMKQPGFKASDNDMDALRLNQRLRTYSGKTGSKLDDVKIKYELPFMEKAAQLDGDPLEALGNYWYARFAKIRNKNSKKAREKAGLPVFDENGKPYGSGMTNEEADLIIARTKASKGWKSGVIQDITRDFDRMNQENLKILLDGGVLAKDQYDRLLSSAKDENGDFVWTPLRGFESEMKESFGLDYPTDLDAISEILNQDELGGGQGTGAGFNQKQGELSLQAAFGRTSKANVHEIWGNAYRMHLEAIVRANKNKEVSQSVLALAKQIESNESLRQEWGHIIEIADPTDPDYLEKFGVKKKFKQYVDTKNGREIVMKERTLDPTDAQIEGRDVFTVRVEGRPIHIMFKGEAGIRLSNALKNKGTYHLGPILRGFSMLSGFFSQLYTVWNVDFILTNFFRDFVSGVLNLKSDRETKDFASEMFNPGSVNGNMKAMYKLSRATRSGKLPLTLLNKQDQAFFKDVFGRVKKDRSSVTDEELTKLFNNPMMTAIAMQLSGGKIEFFGLRDVESKTREIFKSIKRIDEGKSFNYRNPIVKIADFINDMNTGVENATRMQAFKIMVMNGSTLQNAAYKGGREGTVDFNRKGNYTNVINALFPFFGAGVAGNARLVRALTAGEKGANTRLQLGMIKALITFGFAYNFAMRFYAGEDEETQEQHWDRLSNWEKKHNLNIFLTPGGDGSRVAIPLPYGWNMLFGMGSNLADLSASALGISDKRYGAVEMGAETMTTLIDTFHPMSGGHGVGRFIPHAFRPFMYELPMNVNFAGNPIKPEPAPWETYNKPDSERFWGSVNPISRDFARKTNTMLGGNKFEKNDFMGGIMDFSPESIDHLVGYYTGTMGRQLYNLMGVGYSKAVGEKSNLDTTRSLPVVSRLYKSETRDISTIQRFYDLQKVVNAKEKYIEDLEESNALGESKQVRKENSKYLRLSPLLSSHKSRISKIQRDIKKRVKAGVNKSKIQLLEDRLQNEKIRGMSSILKKARELGVRV